MISTTRLTATKTPISEIGNRDRERICRRCGIAYKRHSEELDKRFKGRCSDCVSVENLMEGKTRFPNRKPRRKAAACTE